MNVPAGEQGLFDRSGLAAADRALLLVQAAVWPGDASELARWIAVARDRGVPRRDLEETLLQAVLFFGFPRCITAFETLQAQWPDAVAPGEALAAAAQPAAGRALFAAIYGANSETVQQHLGRLHPELRDHVLDCAYGRILTRPALAPKRRELLAVGALAVLQQVPQLVAHARGALGFGATVQEVGEAVWTIWRDDTRVAELLRKVGARRS